MENKIIDYVLTTLNIHDFVHINRANIFHHTGLDRSNLQIILESVDMMEHYGLIEFSGNVHASGRLTKFGLDVQRVGGWIKYNEEIIKRQERQSEKEKYDLMILRYQHKFRFLPHFLSGIAVIVSFLALYISYLDYKNGQDKNSNVRKEKIIIHEKMKT